MNKRMKLLYPNGESYWGMATTEHSQSSYGQTVITSQNKVYSTLDLHLIGVKLVTTDLKVGEELKKQGFDVVISKRTSNEVKGKYNKNAYQAHTLRIKKGTKLCDSVDSYKKSGKSLNELTTSLLAEFFELDQDEKAE